MNFEKNNLGNNTNYLISHKLIRLNECLLISNKTRDVLDIKVYKDLNSGMIFLDKAIDAAHDYESGNYLDSNYYVNEFGERNRTSDFLQTSIQFEELEDNERRIDSLKQFICGKSVLDFGCGEGTFLKNVKNLCKEVAGLELQEDYRLILEKCNIECYQSIESLPEKKNFDLITMFHVLEHLPNPIEILMELKSKLNENGKIAIEVPHSKDFLLEFMNVEEFKDFSLWSQHLVLHSRNSLENFLKIAGFKNIVIYGHQRHSLSNHMQWLKDKKGGGHKSNLSLIEEENDRVFYKNFLSKIDANDTLFAIASK